MGLSPASSDGGSFDGGTITTPLTVDAGGAAEAQLYADATSAQVNLDSGAGTGGAFLSGDTVGGSLVMTGAAAGTTWSVGMSSSITSDRVNIVNDDTGAAPLTVDPNGYLLVATHAAPADAALDSGECALWFDQTNGAAKLMVKAKQADGTVKTAAIALA